MGRDLWALRKARRISVVNPAKLGEYEIGELPVWRSRGLAIAAVAMVAYALHAKRKGR